MSITTDSMTKSASGNELHVLLLRMYSLKMGLFHCVKHSQSDESNKKRHYHKEAIYHSTFHLLLKMC